MDLDRIIQWARRYTWTKPLEKLYGGLMDAWTTYKLGSVYTMFLGATYPDQHERIVRGLWDLRPVGPIPFDNFFSIAQDLSSCSNNNRLIEQLVLRQSCDPPLSRSVDHSLLLAWFAGYWFAQFLGTHRDDPTRMTKRVFSMRHRYGDHEEQELLREWTGGRVLLDSGFAPTRRFLLLSKGRRVAHAACGLDHFVPDGHYEHHVGLPVIHTLLLREHNRMCNVAQHAHPLWCDQRLFDAACVWTHLLLLSIVQTEYLSTLVGRATTSYALPACMCPMRRVVEGRLSRGPSTTGIFAEYQLAHVFHSAIEDVLYVPGEKSVVVPVQEPCSETLAKFTTKDEGFNRLLRVALQTGGLPLARTHGSPRVLKQAEARIYALQRANRVLPFNALRRELGLIPYATFEEMTQGDTRTQETLLCHVDSVDEVDFYTGLLVENAHCREDGTPLGPTATAILTTLLYSHLPPLLRTLRGGCGPTLRHHEQRARTRGFLRHLIEANTPIQVPVMHTFRVVDLLV